MQHEAAEVEDLSEAVSVSLHGRNIVKLESLELCNNLRVLDLSFNLLKRLDGCGQRHRCANTALVHTGAHIKR